ncbi:MAG TPA: hypothetical protein VHB01_05980 [Nitrosospira sp.]|nr:hypothetical protein [Nitrosospira sp.]
MSDRKPEIRAMGFLLYAMVLLWARDGLASGKNQEFRASCRKLGDAVRIAATYRDIVPTEDSSRSVKSLRSLSGKTGDPYHHVYGLTHAEPAFSYRFMPRWHTGPDGQVCALPDVSVEIGFSSMRVYLARELQETCRKGVVRDHEMEHVSAWKSHLRAGARLLEGPLHQAFSQPRYYRTQAEAEAGLKLWVEEEMKLLWKRLMDSAITAHRTIDSPLSYNQVNNRLRNCPPDARHPF